MSRHDVRLGVFEVLAEGGVEAVAQAQQLDRVQSPLGDSLFHLDPAGAAFGRADLDIAVAEAPEQAAAGPERGPEAIAGQPVSAAHARAAAVDELDVELQDVAQQLETRRADVECPQVARLMIADAGVQRLAWARELAAGVEAEQILADVHRVGGDELGIEVFGQLDVLVAEHQGGGRLGADDRVAVADGVGQGRGGSPAPGRARDRRRRRSRQPCPSCAAGRNVDVDFGLAEHGDDGLGELLVVVVGEDVDEVDDPRARLIGGAACSSRAGPRGG